eukprot:scaffold85902_cov23-Tisochrysis_lutea.AAC.1
MRVTPVAQRPQARDISSTAVCESNIDVPVLWLRQVHQNESRQDKCIACTSPCCNTGYDGTMSIQSAQQPSVAQHAAVAIHDAAGRPGAGQHLRMEALPCAVHSTPHLQLCF